MIVLNPLSVKVKTNPNTPVSPVLVESPVSSPTTPITEEINSEIEEELNRMMGTNFESAPYVVTHSGPSKNMEPITLNMLQDLYNFTPPGNRNGKTPEQVFEELVGLGIPYLAEGHNPFFKCT
jgi:hypothetical protein